MFTHVTFLTFSGDNEVKLLRLNGIVPLCRRLKRGQVGSPRARSNGGSGGRELVARPSHATTAAGMAWLPGLDSVCDRLRQSPVSFEQGSESDEEGDASPWRINAYLRREFGLATPHAALSLSSLPPLPLLPPDITVATSPPPPPLPPPHLLLDACGLSQMRPLQPNTDLGQLLLEYSGDEGQVCADADDDACDDFDDEPGASMLPRELRSSNLTQCGDAVDIIAPAEQQGQGAPFAAPKLGSCTSSGRAWRGSGQSGTPRVRPAHWARGHCSS